MAANFAVVSREKGHARSADMSAARSATRAQPVILVELVHKVRTK